MALAANREVDRYVDQELRSFPVKASAHVYKGALVGHNGGYARGLVAADPFLGVAYEEADNSAGSDGDKDVRVYTIGDFDLALSGAAVTNLDDLVYASADGTLTFTSTSNSFVGRCVGVPSSGRIVLRLEGFNPTP